MTQGKDLNNILAAIFSYGALSVKQPKFDEVLKTLVVVKKMELKQLLEEKITALKNKDWKGDGDLINYGQEGLYKEVIKIIESL